MNSKRLRGLFAILALLLTSAAFGGNDKESEKELPITDEVPKPPPGFTQKVTVSHTVETDVSAEYTDKVAKMVYNAEQRYYKLFAKLSPDMMKGTSKVPYDAKANIPGDIVRKWFKEVPYIELRVFKSQQSFADEWFDNRDQMTGTVTDKRTRLTSGLPGAYYSTSQIGPYDKRGIRRIRSYVDNRDDDELERTLIHEMGHLFMFAYIVEIGGDPPKGQEAQKRGCPSWLAEGVARLFEHLWSKAATAQKESTREQMMIYEAIKIGDSYPFEEFINVTNAHNLQAIAGNPLKATINYAQSASVMDYFVNVDGKRFFDFLDNLRALNFERNLHAKDKNHVPELYSFQNEAFKKAFNIDIVGVEKYWRDNVKKTTEEKLKKNPELYYWIGEYYLRRGKDKANDILSAQENFKLAMEKAPTKGEGYLGMGRMYLGKGDSEQALKNLSKAAELMPKDDDALYWYGVALNNAGQVKEAVETFDKLVKVYPRNHRALAGQGQALFYLGEYQKSMEAYDKAYMAFRNPWYLFNKGHSAFFGKKFRDAQAGFATFSEWFPSDASALFWYGEAAWRLAQTDKDRAFALEKLEAALKLNPGDEMLKAGVEMAKRGETLRFNGEPPDLPAGEKPPPPTANGEKKPPPPKIKVEDE